MSCICNPQGTCVCRTPLTITTIPHVLCVDPTHSKLEEELDAARMAVDLLKKDEEMFLNEHDENVRLHFENVDLKEQNARLRGALEWMVNNQHLTIMIEEPEHVEHFMSRARAALEGK